MNKLSIPQYSGIYKISNLVTGKVYIGMSGNISLRCQEHLTNLRNNHHLDRGLQNDFNTFGTDSFTFEIIEFIPADDLALMRKKEKYWIKQFASIYNIGPGSYPNNKQINKNGVKIDELKIITINGSAYVTIRELAQQLDVTWKSVYLWVRSGIFPNYIKHNGVIAIPVSDLHPFSK